MSAVSSDQLLELAIVAALTDQSMTPRELCECVPVYEPVAIRNAMWRLIDCGKIVLTIDCKIALASS